MYALRAALASGRYQISWRLEAVLDALASDARVSDLHLALHPASLPDRCEQRTA